MTKTFCDLCGKECGTCTHVIVSINNWKAQGGVDICKACLPMCDMDNKDFALMAKEVLLAPHRSNSTFPI